MSTTIADNLKEVVRELTAKIPNIEELVREAKKAPDTPVADTAYIYNGYDDLTLDYLGRYKYELKRGQVTRIDPLPNHKEINQNDSNGAEVKWRLIPLKGESIAREIIETRGFNERGIFVSTDPRIGQRMKDEADATGRAWILTQIEAFKVGRDKARAGIAGYKLKPDPSVYRWMQQFTPDDELFGEQHRKADQQGQIASAIDLLTKLVVGKAEIPKVELPRLRPMEQAKEYKERLTRIMNGTADDADKVDMEA